MALQGTIQDFGLGDIFQMIGIQRKTGTLTLENGEDSVTVKFLGGQVVGADTRSRSVEDLLGAVLVRTGRLTEAQLESALQIQGKTLQRLGHVLVKERFISEDDLIEALRVQSLQIVYRLFRWHDGSYSFRTTDNLEYDDKHFTPISAETILMEGARMIDEWPIIERRIKSDQMVLRQTGAAEQLNLGVESIVDADVDFDFAPHDGNAPADRVADGREIKLSADEREILTLVDGKRTVEEITDRCPLGEFDVHRILAELLTRNLVEEVRRTVPGQADRRRSALPGRLFQLLLHGIVAAPVFLALATLDANPFTPWKLTAADPATRQLRRYASGQQLERIERSIRVFYYDAGTFPDSLELLARNGYLGATDLVDPWGRPYGYRLGAEGYRVFAVNPEGTGESDLRLERRFTPLQRRMLEPEAEEATGPKSN